MKPLRIRPGENKRDTINVVGAPHSSCKAVEPQFSIVLSLGSAHLTCLPILTSRRFRWSQPLFPFTHRDSYLPSLTTPMVLIPHPQAFYRSSVSSLVLPILTFRWRVLGP